MTNSSLPGIPSYFWLNDHWVKFRLIVNNYQNIISFFDAHDISFLSEMTLDFTKIPLILHGKGNSKNLLEYLSKNTDDNNLILSFLTYFMVHIIKMKYNSGELLNFNFETQTKWQETNFVVHAPNIPITNFILNFNIQNIGDSVFIYAFTSDNSDYIVNWNDGIIDTIPSDNEIDHTYNVIDQYNAIVSPASLLTEFVLILSDPNVYTTVKKSAYSLLKGLQFLAIWSNVSVIEEGALDSCPLENIFLKYQQISSLKNYMFNNIPTLKYISFGEGLVITDFESGIFSNMSGTISNQNSIQFNSTPFATVSLVDEFLIDLNNSNLSYCDITIDTTCRSGDSNSAVDSLVSRGCTVSVPSCG